MALSEEVIDEYKTSLADLSVNSKPLINMLTMLAEDHEQHAPEIVAVIEDHIHKCKPAKKLPVLYLIDSIMKNLGQTNYKSLFAKNIVQTFTSVFEQVDEKTRASMFKLRQTWSSILPNQKLYMVDVRINNLMDPAWPITATAPEKTSIHVNPKFLSKPGSSGSGSERSSPEAMQEEEEEEEEEEDSVSQEAIMRQQLIAKQQELLELQQARIRLELAEAEEKLKSHRKHTTKPRTVTKASALPLPPVIDDPVPVIETPQLPAEPPVRKGDPRKRDPRFQTNHSRANYPESALVKEEVAPATVPHINPASVPHLNPVGGQHLGYAGPPVGMTGFPSSSLPVASQMDALAFQQGMVPHMQTMYGETPQIFRGVVFPDDAKFSDSNDSDSSRSSAQESRIGGTTVQPRVNVKDPRLRKQLQEQAKETQSIRNEASKPGSADMSRDPRQRSKSPKTVSSNQQKDIKDNKNVKDSQHGRSSKEHENVQSSSKSPKKSASDIHHNSKGKASPKDRESKSVPNLRQTFESSKRKHEDDKRKDTDKDSKSRKKDTISRPSDRSSRSKERSPEKSTKQSSKTNVHKGAGDNVSHKGGRKDNEGPSKNERKHDSRNSTDKQSGNKSHNLNTSNSDTKQKNMAESEQRSEPLSSKSTKREKRSEEREEDERASKKQRISKEEEETDQSKDVPEVTETESKVSNDLSDLFGSEDIDYRPVDNKGLPLKSPSSKGWDKYKASQPEKFAYDIELKKHRQDLDQRRTRQMSEASENQDTDLRVQREDSFQSDAMLSPPVTQQDIPKELSLSQHSEIIIQAQKQLREGRITSKQHQDLMQQVQELMHIQQQLQNENSKSDSETVSQLGDQTNLNEKKEPLSPNNAANKPDTNDRNVFHSLESDLLQTSPRQELQQNQAQSYPEGQLPERDTRSPERPMERFKIPKKSHDADSPKKQKRGLHELYPERIKEEAWESGPPVLSREFNDHPQYDDHRFEHPDQQAPPDLKGSQRPAHEKIKQPEQLRDRRGPNFRKEQYERPPEDFREPPFDDVNRPYRGKGQEVKPGPQEWRRHGSDESWNERGNREEPLPFDRKDKMRGPHWEAPYREGPDERREHFKEPWNMSDRERRDSRYPPGKQFDDREQAQNWRNVPRAEGQRRRESDGGQPEEREWYPSRNERGHDGPHNELAPFEGGPGGSSRGPRFDGPEGSEFHRRDMTRPEFEKHRPFFDRKGQAGPNIDEHDRPPEFHRPDDRRPLADSPDNSRMPFERAGPPEQGRHDILGPSDRLVDPRGPPFDRSGPHEFDRQGPPRPDVDLKGPQRGESMRAEFEGRGPQRDGPDFNRSGPPRSEFDRPRPPGPDFDRHVPPLPDFNRQGPPGSDSGRQGPPGPDFGRQGHPGLDFGKKGPSGPDFNRQGPPGEIDRQRPSVPDFDRPGPPRPDFGKQGPSGPDFDRQGPHRPSEQDFDRQGPPGPEFGRQGQRRPDFERQGPHGPDFGRKGPPGPDFDRQGPHGPDFDRQGPPGRDFGRQGPQGPDFDRQGPHGPDFDRQGPHGPDFGRQGPPGPDFGRQGPLESGFDQQGPPGPDFDRKGYSGPTYDDRRGPPGHDFDKPGPARNEFSRPGPEFDRPGSPKLCPPGPPFGRPGPPRPDFDTPVPPRPGQPGPEFDRQGQPKSEIDRKGPPGPEFDRYGPMRPEFDRPRPGPDFDRQPPEMEGPGFHDSDFDRHGPSRQDYNRPGPPWSDFERPGPPRSEFDRPGPPNRDHDRNSPPFDNRHRNLRQDSDRSGPGDRFDRQRRYEGDKSGRHRSEYDEDYDRAGRKDQEYDRNRGSRSDRRGSPLEQRESLNRDSSRKNKEGDRRSDRGRDKRRRRTPPNEDTDKDKPQSRSRRSGRGSSRDTDSQQEESKKSNSRSESKKQIKEEPKKEESHQEKEEKDKNKQDKNKNSEKEKTNQETKDKEEKTKFDPNKGLPPWQPVGKRKSPMKEKTEKKEKSDTDKSGSKDKSKKHHPDDKSAHRKSPPLLKPHLKQEVEEKRKQPDKIPSLLDQIEPKLPPKVQESRPVIQPRQRAPMDGPFNPLPAEIIAPFEGGPKDRPPKDKNNRPEPPQQLMETYVDKYGDPRFRSFADMGPEVSEEVVFGKRNYEIKLGAPPRKIQWGNGFIEVYADPSKRGVVIDNELMYRFGERVKEVSIRGKRVKIFYHGKPLDIWIDGNYYEVRVDSPPKTLFINNQAHRIQVDGRDMMILIDKAEKGPYGGEPRFILIDDIRMELRFDPPPRHILIDGEMCELKLNVRQPCINIKGVLHGIRFKGPPRDVFINGSCYQIFTDHAVKLRVGNKFHYVALGGPCHEIIIDGKWYEVKFDEPPKEINAGNRVFMIHIPGAPPEVKILEPIAQEPPNMLMFNPGPPRMPMPGQLMGPGPQPMMPGMPPMMLGQPMPVPNPMNQLLPGFRPPMSAQSTSVMPGFGGVMPGIQSSQPNRMPMTGMGPSSGMPNVLSNLFPARPAAPAPAGSLDINSLLSKLMSSGIIKKEGDTKPLVSKAETVPAVKQDVGKPPEVGNVTANKKPLKTESEIFEEIPDKTAFELGDLKELHIGSIQRLYAGAQCNSCGTRFLLDDDTKAEYYKQHLDWHFRQNKLKKDDTKVTRCRKWFYGVGDWIQYEEVTDLEDQSKSVFFEQQSNVQQTTPSQTPQIALITVPEGASVVKCPAATGSDQDDLCNICHEPFEQFWDEELEEWHLRDAIRVNQKTYHPICYEDYTDVSEGTPSPSVLLDKRPDFSSRKSLTYEESSQDGLPHSSFEEERVVPMTPSTSESVLSLQKHIKTEPSSETSIKNESSNVTVKNEPTDNSIQIKTEAPAGSDASIDSKTDVKQSLSVYASIADASSEPRVAFIKQESAEGVKYEEMESDRLFAKTYSKNAIPGLDVSYEEEKETMDVDENVKEEKPTSSNIIDKTEPMVTDPVNVAESMETHETIKPESVSDQARTELKVDSLDKDLESTDKTDEEVSEISESAIHREKTHLSNVEEHGTSHMTAQPIPCVSHVQETMDQSISHIQTIESNIEMHTLETPVQHSSTLSPLKRVLVSQPPDVLEISQEVLEISSNASTPTHDELPSPPSPGS